MVYFVSDVHLGSLVVADPEQHQQRFIALLQQMERDAEAVYLLGDIFDFWMEYYWCPERHFRPFNPVLDALQHLSSRCPVHFFIGNHDIWTFGWLARRTGMQVHRTPEEATLYGKRCFLAHGDGLGSTDSRFLHLRRFFHSPLPQFLYRLLPPAWGDWFGYRWAASSRRKELASPELYQGEANEELILFAKQRERTSHSDLYIFGHRHIELSLMLPSRACVYILGDFFRQFTFGALSPSGVFSIEQFPSLSDSSSRDASSDNRTGVSIAFM